MPPRASVGPGCGTGPGHRRTLPWAGEISKLSLNMAPKWRAERRVTSPWLPSESESGPGPGRVRVTVGLGLRVTSRPASSSRLRVRVPGPASLSPSLRFESGSEPHRGPGPAGPRRLLRTESESRVTESSIVEIGLRLLQQADSSEAASSQCSVAAPGPGRQVTVTVTADHDSDATDSVPEARGSDYALRGLIMFRELEAQLKPKTH